MISVGVLSFQNGCINIFQAISGRYDADLLRDVVVAMCPQLPKKK